MFGKSLKLFTILGYEVKIDPSWAILAVLIIWTLAQNYFPTKFEDLSTWAYIWMGIGGAIGLFLSIILHELSHSLVGRQFGTSIKGITLFVFGGAAHMADESRSPKAEFLMAIAGPISSVIIAGIFYGLNVFIAERFFPGPVSGVLIYLALINLILAGFNLLPAFPLDGGRALRALLWKIKNSLKWATRISSKIGTVFGFGLIALGVFGFLAGDFLGGVWMFLLGMFLSSMARGSYEQYLLKESLQDKKVEDFMKEDPVTVPPSITINSFIEDYVLKYHQDNYPVTSDSQPIQCINIERAKSIPRGNWGDKKVSDLAESCSDNNSIKSSASAEKALSAMAGKGKKRLLVVDNGRFRGVINLKDIMEYTSLKKELVPD